MKLKKFFLFSLVLVFTISFAGITPVLSDSTDPVITPQETKDWTFMLYLCADTRDHFVTSDLDNSDNWLNAKMLGTIDSLADTYLLPGSEANLNVIALYDAPYSQAYPNGQAKILQVKPGGISQKVDYGPINMGDPQTLENFIDYCKDNYPANNYALTLSDHGRGYAGFCYDYHAPHPYWEYALGDCLSVAELESALAASGGVDTLFIDCCLGGSFEVMWQLKDEVHYVCTGESPQPGRSLYRPLDVLYNLSRDTSMNPLQVAFEGYRSAQNPVLYNPGDDTQDVFYTQAVYDLEQFDNLPDYGGSLMEAFNQFTFYLFDEVTYNVTRAREIFSEIRHKLWQPNTIFSSDTLMVDLGDFVTTVLEYTNKMHNQIDLDNYGSQLLTLLAPSFPSTGNTIIDHWEKIFYDDNNLTGFSICFPESLEMYQGFLYPNFYNDLDICVNSYWDEFIFNLYPPPNMMFQMPKIEYYEFYLEKIDPSIHLHIYLEGEPFEEPIHIGVTNPIYANIGMDIEIGIEGATYQDSMIFGNTQIKIPVASIPAVSKASTTNFQVVVNASSAASAVKAVNLTVRHIDPTGVVWEDTKISDIEIGQVIRTNVSTTDEWTDWEILTPPTTISKFSGFDLPAASISIVFTCTILAISVRRRKHYVINEK
ncbi:MAG TPA: clostripain-related cysteine peptidase [candidate division Zixibacteria bacterium]|nr:clostripain-related cysteine peptidase [candidate division Zixibacteria bacterium]